MSIEKQRPASLRSELQRRHDQRTHNLSLLSDWWQSRPNFERLLLENSIFFRLSSPSSCNSSWWAIPTLDRRASLQESRFSNCTIFKLPRYGQFYLTFIPGHSQVTLESSHVPIKFVFQYFSNRNWVIFFQLGLYWVVKDLWSLAWTVDYRNHPRWSVYFGVLFFTSFTWCVYQHKFTEIYFCL